MSQKTAPLVLQGDWRRWRALCVAALLAGSCGDCALDSRIWDFMVLPGSERGFSPDKGDSPRVRFAHGKGMYMNTAWIRAPGVGCRSPGFRPGAGAAVEPPPPDARGAAEAAVQTPPVSEAAAAGRAGRCGSRRRGAACFGSRRRRPRRALRKPPPRRRLFRKPPPDAPGAAEAAAKGLDRAPWSGRGFLERARGAGSRAMARPWIPGARPWGWIARHGAAVDSWSAPVGLACAPWGGRGFLERAYGAGLRAMEHPWIPWSARARHARAPAHHVRRPRAPRRGASARVAPARIPRQWRRRGIGDKKKRPGAGASGRR